MTAIAQEMEALVEIAKEAEETTVHARASDLLQQMLYDRVHLVIIGEFNRGKTTLVNSLIGEALLPMDIIPTTAAIWTIQAGDYLRVQMIKTDKSLVDIPATSNSLKRFSAEGDLAQAGVHHIEVNTPSLAVGDKIVVVDTPGVNDINEQRADVTYGYLGAAEAAVFVLDASSPVTRSEAEFIQGQLLASNLDKMLFVLNKSGRLDEDELEEGMEFAEERLMELTGKNVSIVATDCQNILAALIEGDLEKANEWGWAELREKLNALLQEATAKENREKTSRHMLAGVKQSLQQRLDARQSALQLSEAEARHAIEKRQMSAHERRERFSRLLGFIDQQGRERLKAMISTAMHNQADEFLLAQRPKLAAIGDVKKYATDILPHELQLFAKKWYEQQIPQIERFLDEFSKHVSQEYETHFNQRFAAGGGQLRRSHTSAQVEGIHLGEGVNEYAMIALPAGAFLGLTFLGMGPFAIVGLAGGMMFKKWFADKESDKMRDLLVAELPGAVQKLLSSPLEGLHEASDIWFNEFKAALERQFEADQAATDRAFQLALQRHDSQGKEVEIRQLEDWLTRLNA